MKRRPQAVPARREPSDWPNLVGWAVLGMGLLGVLRMALAAGRWWQ